MRRTSLDQNQRQRAAHASASGRNAGTGRAMNKAANGVWRGARTGGHAARNGALRPPWSTEASVRAACTSCGDCVGACPEGILVPGPAGTPVIDFGLGACTFCEGCARACSEAVFDLARPPWDLVATLDRSCFLTSGISCRSCTDACDTGALRFDLGARPVGRIAVDADACTGCGACVGICPAGAISVASRAPAPEAVS